MKMICLLLPGIFLAANVFGQAPYQRTLLNASEVRPAVTEGRAAGDVILTYEDDFSNPGNWILSNAGSPAADFIISNVGPASELSNIINSTSGGDFAWYDCDPQGAGSTVDAYLTFATAFDLTAYPYVMVSFEQFYREFETQTFVEISTNGLAGPWTPYEFNEEYADNAASPVNPVQKRINVSSLAGGQANVGVRFRYVGNWGWSWQMDDFALVEAYQNDLSISGTRISAGSEKNEYYMVPASQITEFTFGANIKSNGVVLQQDTYLHVEVDGGVEYDEVSGQLTDLGENASDTFSIETNGWTPSAVGTYDVIFTALTDMNPDELPSDNSVALAPITIGGDVYARDNGIVSGGFAGLQATGDDPVEMGNTFEFFNDALFGKVQVAVTSDATNQGQYIHATVYKYNSGAGAFDYVTNSYDYKIENGDLGTLIEFNLKENVTALAGEIFLVCGGHNGGSIPVYVAQAQPTHENSVYVIHASGQLPVPMPAALIVRPVFEPTEVSIYEFDDNAFTTYPNPADDVFTLTYSLPAGGKTVLTITTVTGELVYAEDFETQSAGHYSRQVNTALLSNGVYFCNLNADGVLTTKKMVISHN